MIWSRCLAWSAFVALSVAACSDRTGSKPVEVEVAPRAVTPRGSGPAIEYTVSFADAANHYLDVEAVFPGGSAPVELMMPVWTPGSYKVRDYARHILSIEAVALDGKELALEKTAKNRWTVDPAGNERFALRYRLYARKMTVQANFVDSDFAVLNGAPTFITMADRPNDHTYDIALELPETWKTSTTALPGRPGTAHRYTAPNYDVLVDSPITAGNPKLFPFEIEKVPHRLISVNHDPIWDGERAAADVATLARTIVEFWRVIPYENYDFINVLAEGGGGLEHLSSTLMIGSRWQTKKRASYLRWLGLVSHEFFHTWNVKRLRPKPLGPFDYEREVHTENLWIAEGITSYYDDLLLSRAGLMKQSEYLKTLSSHVESLQSQPGRKHQALSQASFDTWIRFYQTDENSSNSSISYYTKGAIVGWLLDVEIRRASSGKRSLDDAMRLMYSRYSGAAGYTPEDFRAVVAEVAGTSLDEFFDNYVDGTRELNYAPALDYFGLRFARSSDDKKKKGSGDSDEDEKAGWLGAQVSDSGTISRVPHETPAFAAGLNVDDELLAIDGYRVRGWGLSSRLERYNPGDEVTLLIARRGKLRQLKVVLGEEPDRNYNIERDPNATVPQNSRFFDWLPKGADSGAPEDRASSATQ